PAREAYADETYRAWLGDRGRVRGRQLNEADRDVANRRANHLQIEVLEVRQRQRRGERVENGEDRCGIVQENECQRRTRRSDLEFVVSPKGNVGWQSVLSNLLCGRRDL